MPTQEQWLQDYAYLALRINKVMPAHTEVPYVDGYYGPWEWKFAVDAETPMSEAALIHAAMMLMDTLSAYNFESRRATFLQKQVRAMETVCRKLNGEVFTLQDEVQRIYDLRAEWVPEAQLAEAMAVYDAVLPGKGTLADRLHMWNQQYIPAPSYSNRIPIVIERILAEIRRRTQAIVTLPEGEAVEIQMVTDKPFSAANFYQGNYHTLIEINSDRPISVLELVDALCHEVYPGHHTECILKDQHLYREHGYVEVAVPIVLSPPCLISEGIAMSAQDILFGPGELEAWLSEHVYPEFGLTPDRVDLRLLRSASDTLMNGAGCNAAFLLREGRPIDEIQDYVVTYLLPAGMVNHLHDTPFMDSYFSTYYYGKRMVSSLLQAGARDEVLRHLLIE